MFPGGNGARSVPPSGIYRSIRLAKISVIQTGIFGRMERARKNNVAICCDRLAGASDPYSDLPLLGAIRDCAIIIWRGGSKISKVGLKIKLHPPELKLK